MRYCLLRSEWGDWYLCLVENREQGRDFLWDYLSDESLPWPSWLKYIAGPDHITFEAPQ